MNVKLRIKPVIQYRTLLTQASIILASKTPVNLSFKVVGIGTVEPEAPPIFLLHELLGCKKLWKAIGKTITHITKRTVIVVDQRNHGASPHISSNNYDETAADLIQLFDKLNVDKASLIGYDIGGRTAMSTSLIAPTRVAELVVVEISPVSTSNQMRNMLRLLKTMETVDFKNPKKVETAKKEAKKQLKELIEDDGVMNRVMNNIVIKSDGIIGWRCNLEALIRNFNQLLVFPKSLLGKKYHGPCMFIGGQLSEYIPADDLVKIRELFPQAVVRYIAKAGHDLHLKDPRAFLELVIVFLDANAPNKRPYTYG